MKRMRYRDLPDFLRLSKKSKFVERDDSYGAYRPLMAIWLLEMALHFHWYRKPGRDELPSILEEDNPFALLTDLHVEPSIDVDGDDEDVDQVRAIRKLSNAVIARKLNAKLAAWKRKILTGDMTLICNVELLGRALAFDPADLAVLSFALILKSMSIFERIISEQNQTVSTRQLADLIAVLTGHDAVDIVRALRADARLAESGLVTVDQENQDIEHKLDVMSNLAGTMLIPHENEQELIAHFLRPAGNATLQLDAYPHLATDISTLQAYLSEAKNVDGMGINILFYGPPGTGKTEMANVRFTLIGNTRVQGHG